MSDGVYHFKSIFTILNNAKTCLCVDTYERDHDVMTTVLSGRLSHDNPMVVMVKSFWYSGYDVEVRNDGNIMFI